MHAKLQTSRSEIANLNIFSLIHAKIRIQVNRWYEHVLNYSNIKKPVLKIRIPLPLSEQKRLSMTNVFITGSIQFFSQIRFG